MVEEQEKEDSEVDESEVQEKDVFGLPKMSTNLEVGISFTLFILGMLMVISVVYAVKDIVDTGPAMLGLVMLALSYLFAIEAIRELEEKDHFLSRRLMSR